MIARLEVETTLRNKKTVLKESFCTSPFKIAVINDDLMAGFLNIILMSSSPGILDEDEYSFQFKLGKNTAIYFETQSYQRLFQMQKGASQRVEVRMKSGSVFYYLPHPVVPHYQSKFYGINKIYLAEDCCLLMGEVITCGRKLSGESFLFSSYHSVTEIFKNELLIVRENILMDPLSTDIQSLGQMEEYSHQASLIFIDEGQTMTVFIEEINRQLAGEIDIIYGVSLLQVNGIIVRILGNKGEQLFDCLKSIASLVSLKTEITGSPTLV